MTSSTYNISDEQRETCAVNVMRAMLEAVSYTHLTLPTT